MSMIKKTIALLGLSISLCATGAYGADASGEEVVRLASLAASHASQRPAADQMADAASEARAFEASPQMSLSSEFAERRVWRHFQYSRLTKSEYNACPSENAASVSRRAPAFFADTFAYAIPQESVDEVAAQAAQDAALAASATGLPGVPVMVNNNVEAFINYFQTRGRKHFTKWLGRSNDYMGAVTNILREEGVPEDLFYIAFIESGLNPTARSRANAVGMWQFIKGTAKRYGLRVDPWIDERRDPEKATKAAAGYFKDLYGMFGSWYLAAAGYNAGEGKVMKAIKKHGSEDFWELSSQKKPFRRETKEYVPKYLAAMVIAKDPQSFGFEEASAYGGVGTIAYDRVRVSQSTDLRLVAKAAETSVEEIRRLNPELLRSFTPPNYPEYELKIPVGKAEAFERNMKELPAPQRVKFVDHKVRRGETLAKIAKKYGVDQSQIVYVNGLSGGKLKPGTVILVPIRSKDKTASKVAEHLVRIDAKI